MRPTVPSPTTAMRSPVSAKPSRVIQDQATAAGRPAKGRVLEADGRSAGLGGERVHDLGGQQELVGGGAGPGEADLVVGQAQVGVASRALGAGPVGDDALRDHRLARGQAGHARPDGLDDTGPLVPGHQRVAHVGGIDDACQQLEVGPADPDVRRSGDHLPRARDERGHVVQRDDARLGDDERAVVSHGLLLCCCLAGRGRRRAFPRGLALAGPRRRGRRPRVHLLARSGGSA